MTTQRYLLLIGLALEVLFLFAEASDSLTQPYDDQGLEEDSPDSIEHLLAEMYLDDMIKSENEAVYATEPDDLAPFSWQPRHSAPSSVSKRTSYYPFSPFFPRDLREQYLYGLQKRRRKPSFIGKRAPRLFIGRRSYGDPSGLDTQSADDPIISRSQLLDLLHSFSSSEQKRARLFIGKRSVDDGEKRARMFIGKRAGYDEAEADKRARMFIGKRNRMFIGKKSDTDIDDELDEKRSRMFIGKKSDDEIKRARMFIGKREDDKRSRMFIGKRTMDDEMDDEKRARMFIGKRNRMFIGKRDDLDEEDKRSRMFIGKRMESKKPRMFIGKRDDSAEDKRSRMFIGKRNRMFIGKRYGLAADDDEKRARMFIGKRAEEEKRSRMFIGKRPDALPEMDDNEGPSRLFLEDNSIDDDTEKRARMFIGKRQRMFIGKKDSIPSLDSSLTNSLNGGSKVSSAES